MYPNRMRIDMADGCPERSDLDFLAWVWNYLKDAREVFSEDLKENNENKIVIYKNRRDIEEYLSDL